MKTIGEVLQLSTTYLKERKIEAARRVSEELAAFIVKKKRLDLYLSFEQPLEEKELVALRSLLQRAAKGEPLQYLLNEVPFYRCSIEVTPAVLIPRGETEQMVEEIVKRLEKEDLEGKVLWDLCTGSGCIGIALKKRFPELTVILSDRSSKALAVARANAKRNGVDVELREGDLFAPFSGEKAHFLVSNPPYIDEKTFFTLQASVRDFEPKEALVSGPTGLEFYRRFAQEAPLFLQPKGLFFLEIGETQEREVLSFFSTPPWASVRSALDYALRSRFIFLEKE